MHEHADRDNPTKAVVYGETDSTYTIGGYGVVFAGKDLEGEHFERDTDFWLDRLTRTPPVLYQHGRDDKARRVVLGRAEVSDPDDIGLWVEAQIDLANKYASAIRDLTEKGVLGWSSGTASHLAEREGSLIKSWPIVEMSLTPTPAEPRTLGIREIKDLTDWADMLKDLLPQEAGNASAEGDGPSDTVTIDGTIEHVAEIKETEMTEEIKQAAPTFSVEQMQALVTEAVSKAMREAPIVEKALNVLPEETDRPNTKSFADWLVAVTRRDTKRLNSIYAVKADLAEESGATGGYLVPPEYSNQILQMALGMSVIRPNGAKVFRMQGREFNVPAMSYSGTTAGVPHQLGGLRTYWVAEGATLTESEPTFEQIKLVANKLGGYTQVTAEIQEDAAGISDLLMQLFAQGIAFGEDYAFLNGDGAGEPLGIFNSGALLKEAAGANTFVLSDAAGVMEKFYSPTSGGVWLAHPMSLHEFVEMADAGSKTVWINSARERTPVTFFGKPLIFTECMPVLPAAASSANVGGVLLADLGYYYIGDRGGLRIDYSEHFAFTSDLGTWRFIKRVDGQPAVSQAMYLTDGTNQVSPFVSLAGA